MKYKKAIDNLLKRTEIQEAVELSIKKAYLQGYLDRVKEEERLIPNRFVRFAHLDWSKYNYGAISQEDRCLGEYASGKGMTWYEAHEIPYNRLPTKEEFDDLIKGDDLICQYNCGIDARWNVRATLGKDDNLISFYAWGAYQNGKRITPEKDITYAQVWLADEVSEEKSLTAAIKLKTTFEKGKTPMGPVLTGEVLGVDYLAVNKDVCLQAHFIRTDNVNIKIEDYL